MKFTLDTAQGILVHACQPGEITLKIPNEDPNKPFIRQTCSNSLILGHSKKPQDWIVDNTDSLEIQNFEIAWENRPNIVLLGTGRKQVFPAIEILQRFGIEGIGFEVMDTAAACRTYNVLMAEGRSVIAFLIVD
jgi:uncharacterized protein